MNKQFIVKIKDCGNFWFDTCDTIGIWAEPEVEEGKGSSLCISLDDGKEYKCYADDFGMIIIETFTGQTVEVIKAKAYIDKLITAGKYDENDSRMSILAMQERQRNRPVGTVSPPLGWSTIKNRNLPTTYDEAMNSIQLYMGVGLNLPDETLHLTNDNGWTIAHEMASRGFVFPKDSKLLTLADSNGVTVESVIITR